MSNCNQLIVDSNTSSGCAQTRACDRCLVKARLLREWSRSGKTVPAGFKGTLTAYAWHVAGQLVEEF